MLTRRMIRVFNEEAVRDSLGESVHNLVLTQYVLAFKNQFCEFSSVSLVVKKKGLKLPMLG